MPNMTRLRGFSRKRFNLKRKALHGKTMKKILSLTLAAITAASVFAGCAQRSPEDASPIHAVSSSAETAGTP